MIRNTAIQLDTSVKITSKSTLTVVNRFSAGGQLHRWEIQTVRVGCHPTSWQNDQTTSPLADYLLNEPEMIISCSAGLDTYNELEY